MEGGVFVVGVSLMRGFVGVKSWLVGQLGRSRYPVQAYTKIYSPNFQRENLGDYSCKLQASGSVSWLVCRIFGVGATWGVWAAKMWALDGTHKRVS